MNRRSESFFLALALGLHIALALLLLVSLDKTIVVSSDQPSEPQIIDAVMVKSQTLQQEVARLNAKEEKKRAQERAHQKELLRQEKEAKQKRQQEETLLLALKQKNEQLKQAAAEQLKVQKREEEARQAKRKAEEAALAKIRQEKEAAQAALAAEEKKRAEQQREKEIAEQNARLQRARLSEIERHALLIKNKIRQHWRQPIGMSLDNISCRLTVRLLPTGEVIDAFVVTSSGNVEFDRSSELAVRKASPLPMPTDPLVAQEFRQFDFTFRPEVT